MADAGLTPDDIGMVILSSSSPDYVIPSTGCVAMAKMGMRCPAFDVMAACTGFVYSLQVAADAIAADMATLFRSRFPVLEAPFIPKSRDS